eukprot:365163-Chlamydomonas_euryale.AAC.8
MQTRRPAFGASAGVGAGVPLRGSFTRHRGGVVVSLSRRTLVLAMIVTGGVVGAAFFATSSMRMHARIQIE